MRKSKAGKVSKLCLAAMLGNVNGVTSVSEAWIERQRTQQGNTGK